VNAVTQQLSALSGVRDVRIGANRDEVTILSDGRLPQEAVGAAIDRAGCALDRHHPTPEGSTMITRTTPSPSHDVAQGTPVDRTDLPQYSWRQILGVWLASTAPMSVLAWIIAPWLSHRIGGRDPFIDALLLCFIAGLLWIVVLVLLLVRREQGSLAWPRVRDALWLRAPRDPKSGRVGGRVWWWVLPFVVLSAVANALPIDPTGPLPRDLREALVTERMAHYFHGNWGGFALLTVTAFLAPVAEELVFRGLLLPRMRAVFGRGDVIASGVLFTVYHLHQPWSMPATLIDGIVSQAYPTRRFQSTWMGVITHTAPSFVIFGVVLGLVL
jgi:membrane protease YdiL (CAAX protease family)